MLCPWWVLRKHARGQRHRLGGVRGPVVAGELRFRAATISISWETQVAASAAQPSDTQEIEGPAFGAAARLISGQQPLLFL